MSSLTPPQTPYYHCLPDTRRAATMDGHGPGILPCENETQCQVSRKSKEGKTLTYKLHIIQQPLQARACGSGQKCTLILSSPSRL